jgi:hypothetical protein
MNVVNKKKKPLTGPYTRKEFKAAIWEWLDRYADRIEKELIEEECRKERLERLKRNA